MSKKTKKKGNPLPNNNSNSPDVHSNAEKLKQQGNDAFGYENFEKAIECYSKAIELDNKVAVYYSNRSAAYFNLEEFEKSLQDANVALTLDSKYLKAYNRKASALFEIDNLQEALDAIHLSKEFGDLDEIKVLETKIKEEIQKDHLLPQDDPEMMKIEKMNNWLLSGDTDFNKMKIRFYSKNYRGVHARRNIKNKEMILFVPKTHLITLEMAKQTIVSKKILENKLDLLSPKHSFLSTYLLQERLKADSFWKPYLDILPTDYDSMPIFFSEDDLGWLEGSPFLTQVRDKISDLKKDYDAIVTVANEFAQHSFKDFCWARMTAASRIFGIVIGDVKTDAFVPLADMLNHRRPKQTSWSYSNEKQGFVIESLENIKKGEQIYDSYGKKCNSRFFLHYGFIVTENDGNEVALKVNFNKDDPLLQLKEQFMGEKMEKKTFRIMANFEENNVLEFFGFIRFTELSEKEHLLKLFELYENNKSNHNQDEKEDKDEREGLKPQKTPPITVENEKKMLMIVNKLVSKSLTGYKTSLKDDKELLEKANLTYNQKNCTLLRMGEKEILHYFVDFTEKMLPLFDMPQKDVRKCALHALYIKYSDYINKIILPLMNKQGI